MTRRGSADDSVETVIAAASAIASAGSRVQPGSFQRKRWKSWFTISCCFGSHEQPNRISKAVLVPEPILQLPNPPTMANSTHSSRQVIAPPSSPSSFLQSDPPSTTHSPAKFFSLSALVRESYSPIESSIFAVGPYANDLRLVSPPVFSTEPSTAPLTPPEPLQQTTPSSPEVPFAQLLSSAFDRFHPGSPISHLISPSSARSGASSPLPEFESVLFFPVPDLGNDRITRDNGSILDGRIAAIRPVGEDDLSFEFTAQEVALRLRRRPGVPVERDGAEKVEDSLNLEQLKEFKFNGEGENGVDKNWVFFSMTQHGLS